MYTTLNYWIFKKIIIKINLVETKTLEKDWQGSLGLLMIKIEKLNKVAINKIFHRFKSFIKWKEINKTKMISKRKNNKIIIILKIPMSKKLKSNL